MVSPFSWLIELDQHETVMAEAGAMVYMESVIDSETKLDDGSNPSSGFLGKRLLAGALAITGESIFLTHSNYHGIGKRKVAFPAPHPGMVVLIDLSKVSRNLIVQKDRFLCAALGTSISLHLNRKLGAGLVGDENFILQRLSGDGLAFENAGGTVIEQQLNNESLRIDTGCIVALEPTAVFDVQTSRYLKSMLLGGIGLFLATLSGSGKVWLRSMPIKKLVQAHAPYGRNREKENSSLLGNFLED